MSSFPEQDSFPGGADIRGRSDIRTPAGRPDHLRPVVDVEEASRQLELAAHDIAVASSCIGLGDLDEAHTNVITARAAADAAEEILRVVLASGLDIPL